MKCLAMWSIICGAGILIAGLVPGCERARTTPSIVDLEEVPGLTNEPVLLRLTADQWRDALDTTDVVITKGEPHHGRAIEVTPMPGRPGEVLIAPTLCAPGCEPYWRFDELAKGPGDGGRSLGGLIPDCNCRHELPDPPPDEPDPVLLPECATPAQCRLMLRLDDGLRVRLRPSFVCETRDCDDCAVQVFSPFEPHIQNGSLVVDRRYVICCACE